MKRVLAVILVLILMITATACSNHSATSTTKTTDATATTRTSDITSTPAETVAPTLTNVSLRGFNITAWQMDGWGQNAPVDEALQFALDEGANFLAMDWAVCFNDDGTIVTGGGPFHPPLEDIKALVTKAKALGFYVMLKPHITMTGSPANRNFWNTNPDVFLSSNFFPAWKNYLTNLATQIEQLDVDAICIGTEVNHMDWQFRDEWVDLIDAVRLSFSGALTYDAIFNVFADVKDVGDVIFWDKLDFIGCSLYVPITRDDHATVAALKKGWTYNTIGTIYNIVAYLKNIADKYGKEFMALEGGYQSVNGGLYDLNSLPSQEKVVNYDLQARGLDAYLGVLFESKGTWLKGVSLWQITPAAMTPEALKTIWHTQEFTVYKKPAADIVRKYYSIRK
jgi:hypothetical protein